MALSYGFSFKFYYLPTIYLNTLILYRDRSRERMTVKKYLTVEVDIYVNC